MFHHQLLLLLYVQTEPKVNFRGGTIIHHVNIKIGLDANSLGVVQKFCICQGFMNLFHKCTETRGKGRTGGELQREPEFLVSS